MASARTLEALRNLAERPGTEPEGRVARAKLEQLTGQKYAPASGQHRSTPITYDVPYWDSPPTSPPPRRAKPKAKKPPAPPPQYFTDKLKLAMKVRQRFPIGAAVYYNAPGYDTNSMGTVTGYKAAGVKVRVWFAFLGETAELHACSARGWHLTLNPLTKKTAEKMQKKGVVWE